EDDQRRRAARWRRALCLDANRARRRDDRGSEPENDGSLRDVRQLVRLRLFDLGRELVPRGLSLNVEERIGAGDLAVLADDVDRPLEVRARRVRALRAELRRQLALL